ncbi:TauD/TfdA family dioxygenase [Kitasatospora sp. NPDC085879]|uniref:TauD/TfdA family dioxygenase n=1 Tax=Kitasatospora sp. NPDC085879 TaxID=3154769 RepID=UPI0034409672
MPLDPTTGTSASARLRGHPPHGVLAHTASPGYLYTHRWKQGDLAVRDNLTVLHTASSCDSSRHRDCWSAPPSASRHAAPVPPTGESPPSRPPPDRTGTRVSPMSSQVPMKERALSPERIARIGREMHAACPGFDADAFTTQVTADLPRLELKARIARTAEGLHQHLPVPDRPPSTPCCAPCHPPRRPPAQRPTSACTSTPRTPPT